MFQLILLSPSHCLYQSYFPLFSSCFSSFSSASLLLIYFLSIFFMFLFFSSISFASFPCASYTSFPPFIPFPLPLIIIFFLLLLFLLLLLALWHHPSQEQRESEALSFKAFIPLRWRNCLQIELNPRVGDSASS